MSDEDDDSNEDGDIDEDDDSNEDGDIDVDHEEEVVEFWGTLLLKIIFVNFFTVES